MLGLTSTDSDSVHDRVPENQSEYTHLFEIVQISRALERPKPRYILRQFEWLPRLPVLDESTFIRRNNTIVSVTVLQSNQLSPQFP